MPRGVNINSSAENWNTSAKDFARESHESREKSQLQQIESKKFASISACRAVAEQAEASVSRACSRKGKRQRRFGLEKH